MRITNKGIQVAIADDHTLLRKALARLVASFDNYTVIFEAENGKEVKEKIARHLIPDIILLDVNMPEVDGFETARWIYTHYPQIKVLALSMFSDEKTIIRMLRLGAKGYILKNIDPDELKFALESVMKKDFYLSDYISGKIIRGLNSQVDMPTAETVLLTEKEKQFMRLICSELTYKDIAAMMHVSARSIDYYRNTMFEKLHVRTRVGLVMYAVKHGLSEG